MELLNSGTSEIQMDCGDDSENMQLPVWSEDEIEELHHESLWEVFSSEIDNWAAMNLCAADL